MEENMKITFEQGTHKQKDWVKKMHKNICSMKGKKKDYFEAFIHKVMNQNDVNLTND